jgi:hypothetical protein
MIENTMRDLINLIEKTDLKKQVIDVVKTIDDPTLLQKVLDTLKAGNIEERIKAVLSKDADANRFIEKIADVIVAIKAPVEEKNKFLQQFSKGIVNTSLLLDGRQHTFSELVGPGFNTELFIILSKSLVSQGVGPGEVALSVLSPQIKWSGRTAGGGDVQIGDQAVEVKTSVAAGGRWINARKATMDMTAIQKAIVKSIQDTQKKTGAPAEPIDLPARLNPATWIEQFRSRIDPRLLADTTKSMANGLFNHTDNKMYQQALQKGDAAAIKNSILDVGFNNYKSYSGFDGILLMDVNSQVAQYFKDYASMKGSIKTGTTYVYAPESEAMPQVVLMNTMGGSTDSGDDQVPVPKPGKSAARATATDLDTLAQKRSSIKAAPELPKKYGTKATLGRERQK